MDIKRCTVCKEKLNDIRSLKTIAEEDTQLEQALHDVLDWRGIPEGFYMCLQCRRNVMASWEFKRIYIQMSKATEKENAVEQKEENCDSNEEAEKVSPEVKTDECSDMDTEGKSNTTVNADPPSVHANPKDTE